MTLGTVDLLALQPIAIVDHVVHVDEEQAASIVGSFEASLWKSAHQRRRDEENGSGCRCACTPLADQALGFEAVCTLFGSDFRVAWPAKISVLIPGASHFPLTPHAIVNVRRVQEPCI
jgi:hypothetical protein